MKVSWQNAQTCCYVPAESHPRSCFRTLCWKLDRSAQFLHDYEYNESTCRAQCTCLRLLALSLLQQHQCLGIHPVSMMFCTSCLVYPCPAFSCSPRSAALALPAGSYKVSALSSTLLGLYSEFSWAGWHRQLFLLGNPAPALLLSRSLWKHLTRSRQVVQDELALLVNPGLNAHVSRCLSCPCCRSTSALVLHSESLKICPL